jgi:hypothetical protein
MYNILYSTVPYFFLRRKLFKECVMKHLVQLIVLLLWTAGVVLAKGFWLTILSVVIPFYAVYLVVEQAMLQWLV